MKVELSLDLTFAPAFVTIVLVQVDARYVAVALRCDPIDHAVDGLLPSIHDLCGAAWG